MALKFKSAAFLKAYSVLLLSLFLCLPVIGDAAMRDSGVSADGKPDEFGRRTPMKLIVEVDGRTTVFELNDSRAASDLYSQLPIRISVENYGGNEKIFYPPKKLNVSGAPKADAKAGTLAYYAPWGDVVMFYKDFGSASGLYELGQAVSGAEHIKDMSGKIAIKKSE